VVDNFRVDVGGVKFYPKLRKGSVRKDSRNNRAGFLQVVCFLSCIMEFCSAVGAGFAVSAPKQVYQPKMTHHSQTA